MVNKSNMDYYLVGGAVRDKVMGNEPNDKDYVVVGETPGSMKGRGFDQVGQGFPVFLDETGTEYALARTEQNTGDGYSGFECDWDGVSLKEDLKRRDFTINAMAMDDDGNIIDPFNGKEHIELCQLRPVSDSFREDPLRVLRACRFSTRFDVYFTMTESLIDMCKDIAPKLTALPGERIGEEIIKGIKQSSFVDTYFSVMGKLDVLKYVAPELELLKHVPAGYNDHHLEGSAWQHTVMVLKETQCIAGNDVKTILGALCHDIGKYVTHYTKAEKNHGGHDTRGIPLIEKLAERWKLSNEYKKAMVDGARFHLRLMNVPSMKSGKTIKFVDKLSDTERLLDIVEADRYGRIPKSYFDRDEIETHVKLAKKAIKDYTGQDLIDEGYEGDGEAFGQTLLNRRSSLYSKYVEEQFNE